MISGRLAAAREQMSHYDEFDYVVINQDFDLAVDELCSIFVASRLRRERQARRHADLIAALLHEDRGLCFSAGAEDGASPP